MPEPFVNPIYQTPGLPVQSLGRWWEATSASCLKSPLFFLESQAIFFFLCWSAVAFSFKVEHLLAEQRWKIKYEKYAIVFEGIIVST